MRNTIFEFKSKKETDKERLHQDVYKNNVYIGYIINECKNKYDAFNWYFVGCNKYPILKSMTKKELLIKIKAL